MHLPSARPCSIYGWWCIRTTASGTECLPFWYHLVSCYLCSALNIWCTSYCMLAYGLMSLLCTRHKINPYHTLLYLALPYLNAHISFPVCHSSDVDATVTYPVGRFTLRWRHNERDGVSNRRRLDCVLSRLFRRRSKKTSNLRVTGIM